MSIARDTRHKRTKTGGKPKNFQKKRKFECGRQPAMTKLGGKRVHLVRCRYGFIKRRALRLETGNFSWPTEGISARTRIMNVVYNASNNELVRTNTLVKNSIIVIDATPFRQWYLKHYGVDLSGKKQAAKKAAKAAAPAKAVAAAAPAKEGETAAAAAKKGKKEITKAMKLKQARRLKGHTLEDKLVEQFGNGKLYACISSRPGQVGKADGYILEGEELEFYLKKLDKKKKTK